MSANLYFFEFNDNALEEIRSKYELNGLDRMKEAIHILQEWIQKQSHFKKKDFCKIICIFFGIMNIHCFIGFTVFIAILFLNNINLGKEMLFKGASLVFVVTGLIEKLTPMSCLIFS